MAASGGGSGAGFCPDFPTSPAAGSSVEVLQWLRNLPQAPEYRPTLAEFQDPIAYIFKIEKEASKYGICKIVPPVLPASKKTAMANLNKSLAARAAGSGSGSGSSASKSSPTFTTRQQQIGFCPRKPRPVQKPVWQSGENYTFQEFEAKARAFEKHYLKRYSKKGALSPLEIETLYWKATLDKPFSVEYANDMPGSAFSPKKSGGKEKVVAEGMSVGETEWNMRGVSRAKGSLLRFMKEEIPGVTSPMVYVAMMFSWFAWHVEDHDFHSLNYLHMGAGKTWYGVPRDAAVAFEEVVRVHGYGGEINPLVTFAVLGEKTTVMSPETFVRAGVPCCRLVQNAGDFVVTFPRAYHSGFSHGFNCGEAANIATPEWLTVAKDAAIRRASINYPPMVSHFQLLYDLAIEFSTRVPQSISAKPRSSRLKDKQSGEGEKLVKQHFVMSLMQNNDLLHLLGKRSPIVLLPRSSSDISVCSNLRVGSQLRGNSSLDMCSFRNLVKSSEGSVPDDIMQDRKPGISQVKSFISLKGKFATLCERNRFSSLDGNDNVTSKNTGSDHADKLSDQRLFSCVTCGILTFDCVAVVQPREEAARYLMSSDCGFFNDWTVGSGVPTARFGLAQDAYTSQQNSSTRWMENNRVGGIYDVPVQSANYQTQSVDRSSQLAPIAETHRDSGALGLLALNYGNSSDSDEDQVEPRMSHCTDEINITACSPESKNQSQISALASGKEESHDDGTGSHPLSPSRLNCKEEDPGQAVDLHAEQGCKPDDFSHGSDPILCSMEMDTNTHASSESNCLGVIDTMSMSQTTSDNPPVLHDTEKQKFNRAILPMENTNMSFVLRSDEDSSCMHVFCLQHAVEVEQQLRPIGGVDILLLCHPEYPRIEAEAKLVSEELGIEYLWNDIAFRDANKEDEERIQSALDSEEAIPGNGDWAVKLGINLFYSVSLSWSPLYTKQMAYNSVIYEAFGRSSPASSPRENIYARKSSKQKKVVAGKWCGKVWMSNQVHPLLAKQDSVGDDLEHEQEGSFNCRTVPDEKLKRKQQSINRKETTSSARKFARKRKTTADCGPVKKVKRLDTEDAASADDSRQQPERNCKSKHVKSVEREDELSNISDADTSLQQYRRILRSKRAAQSNQRKNAVSHALTKNKIGKQHQIISRGKQAKSVETEDAGSDEFLEDGTHWWQGKVRNSTQAKSSDGEDAVSDDSQEEGPHQAHCWVPGSKRAKFVEEDAVSDDSLDNSSHRNRNTSRGSHANRIEREDATSDDPEDESTYKHLARFPRGKKAKFNESEDASSDDSLEDNARQQPGRTRSGRRDKLVESEGAVPDDLLEQLRHMRMARNKKSKGIREEDFISDDLREDSSHRRPKKTPRDKQGKFIGRKDAVSDDEDNSDQQHGRVLRSKLGSKKRKPTTPRQMKHETPRHLKPGARPLAKRETKQSVKQERQVKQMALQVRNDKNDQNVRNADSHSEEVEGGPSSRLRKRPSKTSKELGKKVKEKQQADSKKAKNALVAKSVRGNKILKKKDEEAEHRCNIDGCTMSFRSRQELAMHKRNVCPVKGCGKKFFSHKYLVQHRRVHIDDRPLKCPWKGCKKTFKWAWARTEHIRVHTGARPYICAEDGCGQTFRFVSDFSRHKRKTGHSTKTSNH